MNKHTPGPWEVRKPILRGKYRGDFSIGPKSHEGYNQDPVFCHLSKGRDDIQAANAALIAAAPELLEAARDAHAVLTMADRSTDWWNERVRVLGRLQEAFAKSEGR